MPDRTQEQDSKSAPRFSKGPRLAYKRPSAHTSKTLMPNAARCFRRKVWLPISMGRWRPAGGAFQRTPCPLLRAVPGTGMRAGESGAAAIRSHIRRQALLQPVPAPHDRRSRFLAPGLGQDPPAPADGCRRRPCPGHGRHCAAGPYAGPLAVLGIGASFRRRLRAKTSCCPGTCAGKSRGDGSGTP